MTFPNGRDVRTNLLRLPDGRCLSEQPADARLFKSLETFALKPEPLRLFAPFLRIDLCLPLDHPFTMVLSTGAAHTLAVNNDGNGNVGESAS